MKITLFDCVAVIQLILILLKVLNVINCSWWLVFIPVIFFTSIVLTGFLVLGILLVVSIIFADHEKE